MTMATCKDCIHYDRCSYPIDMIFKGTPAEKLTADRFKCFEDKSTFIEVPVKIGDTAWLVKRYKGGAGRTAGIVDKIEIDRYNRLLVNVKYNGYGVWGKRVFKTKEEALAAIQEMGD